MRTFGDNLRSAREREKKTQQEMANLLGITQGVYCQYETAAKAPNINLAAKMAEILNISLDELVKGDPNDN